MANVPKVIWSMRLRLTVVGLLLLLPVAPATAQSDPALLPIPLVTALMAGSQYGSPRVARYVVATTPTGWPAGLVPASPASVVGGMTTGSQLIAIFSDTTKRFLATYLKSLADSGWTQPITDLEARAAHVEAAERDRIHGRELVVPRR